MVLFLIGILAFNSLIGLSIYLVMYKKRKVFSDHYGMIMAMCSSGILSLTIAMVTFFLFQATLSIVALLTTVIGGSIGILFGSLVKYQSLLAGFSQGVIGGIMGTVLGAVILDPSLCSLPSSYSAGINQTMIAFSLFGTALVMITISLLYYSLRV